MNKKTKTALKTIVKECLIEILAEGLVGNNSATVNETRQLRGALQEANEMSNTKRVFKETSFNNTPSKAKSRSFSEKPKSYLDSITTGVDNQKNDRIRETVSRMTNDNIMAEILADTANTTLLEQNQRNGQPSVSQSGDEAAKIASQSDPTELFGDMTGKWADLAFAPSIR